MQNKILIDIKHPAQLNLFKGLADELKSKGWQVFVCYLNRGKLPVIIKREYKGHNLKEVGNSFGTRWSIIWNGNIKRTQTFLKLIRKDKYNICIAASSIPLALACKLTNTPIIQFYDDPERKRINQLNALLSNRLYFPKIVKKTSKIDTFNCLKEWSYLSPKRFTPNIDAIKPYGLKPYQYIFVREVSNKSFNYLHQEDAVISSFSKKISKQYPVLLSLEDKSFMFRFPDNWILLNEPIIDIHSIIYFSKLVISSGDSMAREGAMLGVPSIYCGVRNMKANQILIEKGMLYHLPEEQALSSINDIISKPYKEDYARSKREDLLNHWDDMIEFMTKRIYEFKN